MMRQLSSRSIKLATQFSKNGVVALPTRFSTTFSERERAEESKYFRAQDEMKKAQLRAQFEKMLEKGHDNVPPEVIQHLAPASEEKKTWFSKLGLDDWKIALPVGILVAVPFLENSFIILNAESELLGVFIFTCVVAFKQGAKAVADNFDARSADILKKLGSADDQAIKALEEERVNNNAVVDVPADVKKIFALKDDLAVGKADVLNHMEEHNYREAIVRKLESLSAVEEAATHNIRMRTVNTVKTDVLKRFKTDKAVKDAALDQAVAVLLAGNNAKLGKDVVGDVFKSSLKSYRESYSKIAPEKDELLVQLQKDIAAIVKEPEVKSSGYNVYEHA